MSAQVSIIVPVYKVKKYLDRCVNSLVKQSYSDIQIILVDDGSPDDCGEKCDEWAKKDNRIIAVHKSNGGLSDARNYGMRFATGEYILFVDSDDFVSNCIVEILMKEIIKHGADISCCNYIRTSDDDVAFDTNIQTDFVLTGKEACQAMMNRFHFMTTAWANLLKKEIAESASFPVGRNQEDEATTYKYYYAANKVVVISNGLYGYYQNPTGIMNSNEKKNAIELITALKERRDFFHEKEEMELEMLTLSIYSRYVLKAIKNGYIVPTADIQIVLMDDLKSKFETIKFKSFLFLYMVFGKGILRLLPN